MKLSVIAFLLLGISIATLSIHYTYAQAEKGDDKNKDHQVYQNDAIGISLEYPDDWNLILNTLMACIVIPVSLQRNHGQKRDAQNRI